MQAAPRVIAAVALVWAGLLPTFAVADETAPRRSLFDSVLEGLDLKAKPADPAPEFVTRTRPDASRLDYMQSAVPHKVSPIRTKSPSEIEASKSALDAARAKQMTSAQPVPIVSPKPLEIPPPVTLPPLATPPSPSD